MSKLKVGDKVMWRGAWGTEPPKEAIVESIEICKEGCKEGRPVKSVDWWTVESGRKVVVTLNNSHWAYGNQLSKL
jgi:hypothetical protein